MSKFKVDPSNYIHPTAIIGPNVLMGKNNYIGPHCVIGMRAEHHDVWKGREICRPIGSVSIGDDNILTGLVTVDASMAVSPTVINSNCFIMKHAHIGHDCFIDSQVTISCGAKIGGHSLIAYQANIGLNAVIHQRQKIAEGCMIGMGAVVTAKLKTEPFQTYAGNPAKHIGPNKKFNHEGSSTDAQL